MKLRRTAIGMPIVVLSAIVVILAIALAYTYTTTESQISTLNNQVSTFKQSGHSFCQTLAGQITSLSTTLSGITQALQQQIQGDNSLIATLNSTKPAGYEGMIATLNSQITQDSTIVNQVASLNGPGISSSTNTFCASVSQP